MIRKNLFVCCGVGVATVLVLAAGVKDLPPSMLQPGNVCEVRPCSTCSPPCSDGWYCCTTASGYCGCFPFSCPRVCDVNGSEDPVDMRVFYTADPREDCFRRCDSQYKTCARGCERWSGSKYTECLHGCSIGRYACYGRCR